MPDDNRSTIFEVAEQAGVSITTVSHVFSGKRPVSSATRTRVIDTASRLGYHPSSAAQALATGKTMTLAVEISFSSNEVAFNPYFSSLLEGISVAAVERGYSLALVPGGAAQETFHDLIDREAIDGAILIDPKRGDTFIARLSDSEIPFVSAGRVLDRPDHFNIDNDIDQICRDVLEHLHRRGYTNPALLSIPADTSYPLDLASAFRTRQPEGAIVVAPELSDPAGYATGAALLNAPDRPDALICITDQLAIGALRAARELGLAVPDELGVTGVGDSTLAQHLDPPLTSVRVYPERVGSLLVEALHAILSGSSPDQTRTVVATELIARQSTNRRT